LFFSLFFSFWGFFYVSTSSRPRRQQQFCLQEKNKVDFVFEKTKKFLKRKKIVLNTHVQFF